MTLLEFLERALADDEAVAREAMTVIGDDLATHSIGDWWEKAEHGRVYAGAWHRVVDGGAPVGQRAFTNGAALPHIARHDPARVLAEVAAKRRITALHRLSTEGVEPWAITGCQLCGHDCNTGGDLVVDGPCDTLLALAQPYADRPGWDEGWRLP